MPEQGRTINGQGNNISHTNLTVRELLIKTKGFFREKKLDSPELDAEILLASTLNKRRIDLILEGENPVPEDALNSYREIVRRRIHGEPVAYLLGEKEFYSLTFKVSPDVLIPRPETELIVEISVNWALNKGAESKPKQVQRSVEVLDILEKKLQAKNQETGETENVEALPPEDNTVEKTSFTPAILDIGTGSGCILLSILNELPGAKGLGTDISEKALKIAVENSQKLKINNRAEFHLGNITEPVKDQKFDCVVSNPPYIAHDDPRLAPDVAKHEPSEALYGGQEGSEIIEKLVPEAMSILKPGGIFLMEAGEGQAEKVKVLFEKSDFENIMVYKDLANIERVVSGMKKETP